MCKYQQIRWKCPPPPHRIASHAQKFCMNPYCSLIQSFQYFGPPASGPAVFVPDFRARHSYATKSKPKKKAYVRQTHVCLQKRSEVSANCSPGVIERQPRPWGQMPCRASLAEGETARQMMGRPHRKRHKLLDINRKKNEGDRGRPSDDHAATVAEVAVPGATQHQSSVLTKVHRCDGRILVASCSP
jgi:hypothetical protein